MVGQRFLDGTIDNTQVADATRVVDGESNADMIANVLLAQAKERAYKLDQYMRNLVAWQNDGTVVGLPEDVCNLEK